MQLRTCPYRDQAHPWPTQGRHILAQFDADTVVVYQAYRPEIGQFAAAHGSFGGAFSLNRMSWIKPTLKAGTGAGSPAAMMRRRRLRFLVVARRPVA